MKKALYLAMVLFLTSCANVEGEGKLNIVATTYPQYDWLMSITSGERANANVTLLVGNGQDLHSYQPTAKDIITISTCDMLVYVGGESDQWVKDVLETSQNPDIVAISLFDCVEAQREEHIEGMQDDEHDEHGEAYDEHVWLSVKNAKAICRELARRLSLIDADYADVYEENARSYIEKLSALDERYSEMTGESKRKTVLFADRFPFRYLMDDYELEYFAAFPGCEADAEASFETVAFLASKLDELNLPVVLVIDGSNRELAGTVISCSNDANRQILEMNSMQAVKDLNVSYLSIMEDNLEVLKTALN